MFNRFSYNQHERTTSNSFNYLKILLAVSSMTIKVVSLCTFFFSRNWLQHSLCPAGFASGTVALQIKDGKTSSSHFCSAVGCLLLSYG